MIKDTLNAITDSTLAGIGTTVGVSFIQYFELINPILSFLSLTIGIVIGGMTLFKKIKQHIK